MPVSSVVLWAAGQSREVLQLLSFLPNAFVGGPLRRMSVNSGFISLQRGEKSVLKLHFRGDRKANPRLRCRRHNEFRCLSWSIPKPWNGETHIERNVSSSALITEYNIDAVIFQHLRTRLLRNPVQGGNLCSFQTFLLRRSTYMAKICSALGHTACHRFSSDQGIECCTHG